VLRELAFFIPAADEVARLQRADDLEGKLFRKVAEKGHYAGRVQPTNTRQGTYALTPSGEFLGSLNHNDPKRVADMLRKAKAAWDQMDPALRRLPESQLRPENAPQRFERFYPADGLVLRMTTRDLPRTKTSSDWRGQAFNIDFCWFRRAEMLSMVPEPQAGATAYVSDEVARRWVRLHIIDIVRGQSPVWEPNQVERALFEFKTEDVRGDLQTIRVTGSIRAGDQGQWSIDGFRDMNRPTPQSRGLRLQVMGRAVWSRSKQVFQSFELVLAGERWGATQYNGRSDDPGPAPIGFVFEKARPQERVAPANWWGYGWR